MLDSKFCWEWFLRSIAITDLPELDSISNALCLVYLYRMWRTALPIKSTAVKELGLRGPVYLSPKNEACCLWPVYFHR